MTNLLQWWSHLITLFKGALWAWWRLLPKLLGTYILGRMGYEVCLIGSATISDKHVWLSMLLLSLSFVSLLSATVICLQLLGRELGVRRRLPSGVEEDDRERSVARLLALTLLPFLGIYAAFGEVQRTAGQLLAYEILIRGIGEPGVLRGLDPVPGSRDLWIVVGVIAGAYVVRRAVDLVHEKTGWRPLGLVAAFIESFFLVLLVIVGTNLYYQAKVYLLGVRGIVWLREGNAGFRRSLSDLNAFLPRVVDAVWLFITETLWPLFTSALAEPVLWLAVAALVYGTHVLSFAEMWRKGEPLSVHLDEQRVLRTRRAAARSPEQGGGRGRAVLVEVQELLFGDLNDKYLPTLQSLRLILRGGMVFLGAYLVAYAVVAAATQGLWILTTLVLPLREQSFWIVWRQVVDLAFDPIVETLRLALLATAFVRTLQLFQAHADPSTLQDEVQNSDGFVFPEIVLDDDGTDLERVPATAGPQPQDGAS